MAGKFIKTTVIPFVIFGVFLWLGRYFYMVDGKVDWLRAMIFFGLPFGIPYMFWLIPIRGNISWIAGILALDVIIGSAFGIFIAGWVLLKAMANIPLSLIHILEKS